MQPIWTTSQSEKRHLWAHGQEGLVRWWRPWRPDGSGCDGLRNQREVIWCPVMYYFHYYYSYMPFIKKNIVCLYFIFLSTFLLISSWKVVNIKWLSISGELATLNFEKKVCLGVLTSLNKKRSLKCTWGTKVNFTW